MRKSAVIYIFTFIILYHLSGMSVIAQTGTIAGNIFDQNENLATQVNVNLKFNSSERVECAFSNGSFKCPGTHNVQPLTIEIKANGFRDHLIRLNPNNDNSSLRIVLTAKTSPDDAPITIGPDELQEAESEAKIKKISGSIYDKTNSLILGASVKLRFNSGESIDCAVLSESFLCIHPEDVQPLTIEIESIGFQPYILKLNPNEDNSNLKIVMALRDISGNVTVTADRVEMQTDSATSSITVIELYHAENSAQPTVDDILRQLAGFSTFRRSSSRTSNPTTQGVSLRGVGASGASRSLVLFDGVPINDTFGGWVQWNKLPVAGIDRIEVVRGGNSSLYGSGAVSGTIGVIPRRSEKDFATSGNAYLGMHRTFGGSFFVGKKFGNWEADISTGAITTDGHILTEESARGQADVKAGVDSFNISSRIGRSFGRENNVFIRPSYFVEKRNNGTPLQTNQTYFRQIVTGGRLKPLANFDSFAIDWRVFGSSQGYDQVFTAISADRNSETLSRLQYVPSTTLGISLVVAAVSGRHSLSFGTDIKNTKGESREKGFFNEQNNSLLDTGGKETSIGIFLQDRIKIGNRLILSGSIRFDSWRNYGGRTAETILAGNQFTETIFPTRNESLISPQAAVLLKANKNISFYLSAGRSFRAPTLNELYRSFRVGNVVTNANAGLSAEKAIHVEGGSNVRIAGILLNSSVFFNEIERAVSNVTIATTPNLITRQRQNASEIRSTGVEIEAQKEFSNGFSLYGGYLFVVPKITSFPDNPQLVENDLPQIARHQATFRIGYAMKKWTFSVQTRASSAQYDDDLNTFKLEPYMHSDIFISRIVKDRVHIYAAFENVTNSRYSIGRTPVRTVGSPFGFRAGVKF